MSAYIVEKNHVVYLVAAMMCRSLGNYGASWFHDGKHQEIKPGDYERGAEAANMLWRENMKSVSTRYPHESSATLPGPTEGMEVITEADLSRGHWNRFDPVQVLKSINCLDYQSCEHDGWRESEARAFLNALEHRAIASLPGYEDAEWGAPKKSSATSISLMSLTKGR